MLRSSSTLQIESSQQYSSPFLLSSRCRRWARRRQQLLRHYSPPSPANPKLSFVIVSLAWWLLGCQVFRVMTSLSPGQSLERRVNLFANLNLLMRLRRSTTCFGAYLRRGRPRTVLAFRAAMSCRAVCETYSGRTIRTAKTSCEVLFARVNWILLCLCVLCLPGSSANSSVAF